MPEYLGRGDPRRSLDLLWGDGRTPTRGPKPGLDLATIVRTAIELADAEGLQALSMRRIAERLADAAPVVDGASRRVGTMSLYTYVPSKAELLDVMSDTVFGEQADALRAATADIAAAAAEETVPRWRSGLEARARTDWDLYQRHPWLLQVSGARAVLGPNEMAVYDETLRIVEGLGLTGREMVAVVDLVAMYVGGVARAANEAAQAPRATGVTDNEWWFAREAILTEKMNDPSRFPTVVRVDADGGFDVAGDAADYNLAFVVDDFAFGLQRVLDGIEAFIRVRAAGGGT